jgi:hypothetical protein
MEQSALHHSLKKSFPSTKGKHLVEWDTPHRLNGATSYQLAPLAGDTKLSTSILKLANAMLAEAIAGKTSEPADLVIVIDDVELGNLQQENLVAQHFKAAVEVVIKKSYCDKEAEVREQIRQKCSFHLLKPMVEAYLFADRNALTIAGVATSVEPYLLNATDVEEFEVNDPNVDWLSHCQQKNNDNINIWWREERHAKHYLEHLTGGTNTDNKAGKEALLDLNWRLVTKTSTDAPIISAMFADIADWFGMPVNPLIGTPSTDFWCGNSGIKKNLLLRNM